MSTNKEPWVNVELTPDFARMVADLRKEEDAATAQVVGDDHSTVSAHAVSNCEAEAWAGVVLLEKALQRFVDKRITISDEWKEAAVRDFAPLCVKWGARAPAWLEELMAKYGDEVRALKTFGMIGWDVVGQVRGFRRADAQAANQEEQCKEAA
ncbi:hypothetical protein ACPV36_19565 [Photobacterium damselae]|uniref:hypothetical protein n=1 Tax=Photobacterium damselae TaxID=38293 RepID=UPI004068007B